MELHICNCSFLYRFRPSAGSVLGALNAKEALTSAYLCSFCFFCMIIFLCCKSRIGKKYLHSFTLVSSLCDLHGPASYPEKKLPCLFNVYCGSSRYKQMSHPCDLKLGKLTATHSWRRCLNLDTCSGHWFLKWYLQAIPVLCRQWSSKVAALHEFKHVIWKWLPSVFYFLSFLMLVLLYMLFPQLKSTV